MANFTAHLYGAAAVSSVGALACFSVGWSDPAQTQLYFFLGVAGGLLPDIDSDNSTPVRAFFNLLGVLLGFLVSFSQVGRLALVELALLWFLVFLAIRLLVFEVFTRFTVHRGLWHSQLAVIFVGLLAVNLGMHGLEMAPREAWLSGIFVGLGYLTHLCLDEMSSVNLLNSRVKRSFGTALKPFSTHAPLASSLMLAATLALGYAAPPLEPLVGRDTPLAFADELRVRLLPDQEWVQRVIRVLN